MTKLNHGDRKRIEKVKQQGAYNRGVDANPSDEYFTQEEQDRMLDRVRRESKNMDERAFVDAFNCLFGRLRKGAQEVVLEILKNHLEFPVSRTRDADGIDEIEITFEFSKGDFALRHEKAILILEAMLLAQRKIIEPLANEIKRLNKK